MEKCKKILSLFNKRFKCLYLNGFSEYQILKEIRIFYKMEEEVLLTYLDNREDSIQNNEDIISKRVGNHFCNKIYIDDNLDNKFIEINKICKNVDYNNLSQIQLIEDLLDNPRIPYFEDITLSNAISIYEKPFTGKYIPKKSYIELINGIYQDCLDNHNCENEDNLLLFENAFKYIDYSVSSTKDRIEIYQELTILLSKLSEIYHFEDEIVIRYFNNFSIQFIRDLIRVGDNKYIFNVLRNIYSNSSFNIFISIIPSFLENFPTNLLNKIINCFDKDLFINNNENFINLLNLLILNSGNKKLLLERLNSNSLLSSFERYFSLLEFSINYDTIDAVNYYHDKIRFDRDYNVYQNALSNINTIVENFDKIVKLESKIIKINFHTFNDILIEVEKLNYFDRLVYSCCINRAIYHFINLKEFNFYYLLLLISLGLKEKATIYFYQNIKYISFDNPKELFINANILFMINYYDFSLDMLNRLKKYIGENWNKKLSSLYSYIIIEIDLLDLLMIPIFKDDGIDHINSDKDKKEIV